MNIDAVSDASGAAVNEDLVAMYRHGAVADLLIFDGASSVSERNYFDDELGDPAWFVQRFSALLGDIAAPGLSQEDSVALALTRLRGQTGSRLDIAAVPAFARPIAAMTWIRVKEGRDSVSARIYALGDCKVFLLDKVLAVRDLDPYRNPQEDILREAIARLRRQGIEGRDAIRESLLPMLRERRAFQNLHVSPGILCLDPKGAFDARITALEIGRDATLLAMTDGFYRLTDTYGLYSAAALIRKCAEAGPDALLRELRRFEQGISDGTTVKQSDDASVAICRFN